MARLTREEVLKKLKDGEIYDNILGLCDNIETVTPFLSNERHCKFAFLFLNKGKNSIYISHSNGYEERRKLSNQDVIKIISELKESELKDVYWRMWKTKSTTRISDINNYDMELVKNLKEELKNKTIEELTDITYERLKNNYRIDNYKMVLFYRLSDFVRDSYNGKEDRCKSYKKLYKKLSLRCYEIEFMNKLIKIFGNNYDNHEGCNLKIKDENEDLQFTIKDLLEFKFVIDNYNNIF